MPRYFQSPVELADSIIEYVGAEVVLGLPVGVGKAVHVANALYRRALRDRSIRLTIFTALTLEVPRARSALEHRFLDPLTHRLYGDYPGLDYAAAVAEQQLPENVRVTEFYLRPGGYLGNAEAQRSYTSLNYTHVAAELLKLGVNVIAQLVARRDDAGGNLSLGSNPEVTLDLLSEVERRRGTDRAIALVGQLNADLPYMFGAGELAPESFDFLLEAPALEFRLFAVPNRRVEPEDYAVAMHVASLVPDGGTLQLGIGSLSDALAHCLLLRHRQPALFGDVLTRLPGGPASGRRPDLPLHTDPFREGNYAVTELLSDALFALFAADIVRRAAGEGDATLIHAGFFLGSRALYDGLHALDETRRRCIEMSPISFVNSLHGDERRKRAQRRGACFVNETMMVTLLGAAVSDGLDDGRVVSGVGGQFDFVRMAHELDDARAILMFNGTRAHDGDVRSNLLWEYAHTTVPRHYRDIYANEYGLAATRGQSDEQVVMALLDIADARFQPALCAHARRAGKLPGTYAPQASARLNMPEVIQSVFDTADVRAHFPAYPLGTALTPVEQRLADALIWLERQSAGSRWRTLAAAILSAPSTEHTAALERMGLARPAGLRERVAARLVVKALAATCG